MRARRTADGDQPATHPQAEFAARVAVDENRAAAHAAAAAGVGGADVIRRVAADADDAAAHLAAQMVPRIAVDFQPSAAHGGASVATDRTLNDDLARSH